MQAYDFEVLWENLPFLAHGMELSLFLAVLATSCGILLGTLLALLRLSSNRLFSLLGTGYVNTFRSLPLILVIFWFYFLVPLAVGRPVGPFYSAAIAFILFEAAYYCEIIRAGIQSIPRGQIDAALATGLSHWQGMRHVVVPQAFRNMVPILITQGIVLFQDTSLVYIVSLRDFMTSASIVAARESRLVELYTFAAAVYLVICYSGSLVVRRLQKRIAV